MTSELAGTTRSRSWWKQGRVLDDQRVRFGDRLVGPDRPPRPWNRTWNIVRVLSCLFIWGVWTSAGAR
ncbi:MAG: hypothetical protein ABSB59_41715 [Streptosporangiaceae bacterium]